MLEQEGHGLVKPFLWFLHNGLMAGDPRRILYIALIAGCLGLTVLHLAGQRKRQVTRAMVLVSIGAILSITAGLHQPDIFRLSTSTIIGLMPLLAALEQFALARVVSLVALALLVPTMLTKSEGVRSLPPPDRVAAAQVVTMPAMFRGQRWLPDEVRFYQEAENAFAALADNSLCAFRFHINGSSDTLLAALSPFRKFSLMPMSVWPDDPKARVFSTLRPDLDFASKVAVATDLVVLREVMDGQPYVRLPERFQVFRRIPMPARSHAKGHTHDLEMLVPTECLPAEPDGAQPPGDTASNPGRSG